MHVTIAKDQRTLVEAGPRETPVLGDVDVAVVGGGPAGIAAAVSASRNGANVMLVERYPHLGGMATGGLVVWLYEYDRYEYGILKETAQRLQALDGVYFPPRAQGEMRWIDGLGISGAYGVRFCPETLKFVANEMVLEAGVNLLFNSLFVDAVTDEGGIRGIIVEGKEGRQAVLAKVTIDATGDGDVFARAGAAFQVDTHAWGMSLSWRMVNVDVEKFIKFQKETPAEYNELMRELMERAKETRPMRCVPEVVVKGVTISFSPYLLGLSAIRVKDLARVEIEGRRKIMTAVDFYKERVPGFEAASLLQTASQIGTRASRRLDGEYVLTKQDVLAGRRFPDVIARNLFDLPYRCLLPKRVDGLLVAGRCLSTTREAQESIREMCPCFATGEVAGAAAALAVKHDVEPRKIGVRELQEALVKQGVVIKTL
jgi:hypothetical protein